MIYGQFGSDGSFSSSQILVQSVDGAIIVIDDEYILFKI